ncbi:MAG TPA: ABC transporter ATP-binding protein [Armatimonadota bacterium]|jgi:ATP-binding cassette subfamily B protein
MPTVRELSRFLRPYWKWAALAPALMVLEVTGDLLQPRLLQRIIDEGISRGNLPLVLHTGLLMAGLAVCGIAAGMGCTVFAVKASQAFGADLRHESFARVQALSFGNLDVLETGALITRLTNDVTQVQDVALMLLRIMVRVPLLLVGSLIMAVLTSPRLSLLFIPLIPIVLAILVWITGRMYPLFGEVQRRLDAVNTVLQENLSGVRVVKAFARARHEEGRFGDANKRLADTNIAAARVGAVTMPLMMASVNLGVVGVVWFGGRSVVAGGMEIGQVIAFVNYLMFTMFSLMMVSMLVVRLSRAEASGARITEVLNAKPQIPEAAGAPPAAALRGRVAFENVRFDYAGDGADPALKGISFVAEPGQTVAILGATGSGKSSLVHLIPRFYDATDGRVTIDGVDVREIDEKTLRKTVSIALQESVLFSGTIGDNIRYGRPDATDDEVLSAARAAQADAFIRLLPDGYNSVVGQRGVNLSGGQKQRIAVARALLMRAAVLILDDSTSAVDVATEAAIRAAMTREHPEQTRFIVAQRVSSVAGADRILVLDDGELAGQGTHEELLETSALYREINASQREGGVMTYGG